MRSVRSPALERASACRRGGEVARLQPVAAQALRVREAIERDGSPSPQPGAEFVSVAVGKRLPLVNRPLEVALPQFVATVRWIARQDHLLPVIDPVPDLVWQRTVELLGADGGQVG